MKGRNGIWPLPSRLFSPFSAEQQRDIPGSYPCSAGTLAWHGTCSPRAQWTCLESPVSELWPSPLLLPRRQALKPPQPSLPQRGCSFPGAPHCRCLPRTLLPEMLHRVLSQHNICIYLGWEGDDYLVRFPSVQIWACGWIGSLLPVALWFSLKASLKISKLPLLYDETGANKCKVTSTCS